MTKTLLSSAWRKVAMLVATSTLGVSSQNYSEGSMTDLAREDAWNIWGGDDEEVE